MISFSFLNHSETYNLLIYAEIVRTRIVNQALAYSVSSGDNSSLPARAHLPTFAGAPAPVPARRLLRDQIRKTLNADC